MRFYTPSFEFTRPADTTAYAVNDAIANATSNPAVQELVIPSPMLGPVVSLRWIEVWTDNPNWNAPIQLLLYNQTPNGVVGDNVPMQSLYTNSDGRRVWEGNASAWRGGAAGSTGVQARITGIAHEFQLMPDNKIFVRFMSMSNPTPVASQKFLVRAGVMTF